jgi:formylglycine-generating enzyme required for sulfatase activity
LEKLNLRKSAPELSISEDDLTVPTLVLKEYTCPIINARFVLIPAGTFMMGSHENEQGSYHTETLHHVTISKPFYMQMKPVTQGQWQKVMGNNPSYFKGDDNFPVEQVSWNNAQDFIGRLNRQKGTDKYRLPTEAEWEYACRAGSTTAYCFGDDPARLCKYAWYDDNSGHVTHPVGQKKPNAWGLYDMHGNVWEWVKDRYEVHKSGSVIDPEGPPSGSRRVLRGASWSNPHRDCRSAIRGGGGPGAHGPDMGFRLLSLSSLREIKSEIESDEIKKLIALGEEKGFLTYDDVNDLLPSDVISSDQIDDIIKLFGEKNIDIIDSDTMENSRDGDFIAYNNGTVLDTRTNLIWAGEDNDFGINWADAESYCENYRGGGYTDWRMPTLGELEGLYESGNYKNVIQITGFFVWASETRGSDAATFDFITGERDWGPQTLDYSLRVLPVSSRK